MMCILLLLQFLYIFQIVNWIEDKNSNSLKIDKVLYFLPGCEGEAVGGAVVGIEVKIQFWRGCRRRCGG